MGLCPGLDAGLVRQRPGLVEDGKPVGRRFWLRQRGRGLGNAVIPGGGAFFSQ